MTTFREEGYLSGVVTDAIAEIREENAVWFSLAEEASRAMQGSAAFGTETVQTDQLHANAVATRLMMRAAGNLQAAILMAERAMIAEGKTMGRLLLEAPLFLSALRKEETAVLKMLREDYEASKKRRGMFILDHTNAKFESEAQRQQMVETIAAMGKLAQLDFRKIAEMGDIFKFYLSYQHLSQEAVHVSATSLFRHLMMADDGPGWNYRWGRGTTDEVAAVLSFATKFGCFAGIAYHELVPDAVRSLSYAEILRRIEALPEPDGSALRNAKWALNPVT